MKTIAIIALIFIPFMPSTASQATTNSCPKLEPLIQKYNLPVEAFSKLAWAESRCNKNAVGWNFKTGVKQSPCPKAPFRNYLSLCKNKIASFDSGYWQVNSTWYSLTLKLCGASPQQGALFDGECNAKVASYLFKNGGMKHWK